LMCQFKCSSWCCKSLAQLVQIAAFLCCELILSCSNLASASAAPFKPIYQWYAKYLSASMIATWRGCISIAQPIYLNKERLSPSVMLTCSLYYW
jgi:hypothetical protein